MCMITCYQHIMSNDFTALEHTIESRITALEQADELCHNKTTVEEVNGYFRMWADLEIIYKLKSKWTNKKVPGTCMKVQFRSLPVATTIRIKDLFTRYNLQFTAIA